MKLKLIKIKRGVAEDCAYVDEDRLIDFEKGAYWADNAIYYTSNNIVLAIAGVNKVSELKGHSIWLSSDYDWVFGKDDLGEIVAVPLWKKEE